MDQDNVIEEFIVLDTNGIKNFKKSIEEVKNNTKSTITFVKHMPLDVLSQKIIKKELTKEENISLYIDKKINFKDFTQEELLLIMNFEQLMFIFKEKNIELQHEVKYYQRQLKILESKKEYERFKEYNSCKKLVTEFPHTYIKFPKEKGKKRFVLYYYIFNEKRKESFLKIIKSFIHDEKIINLLKNEKSYNNFAGYGLGFSYNNKNELIRVTLYPAFINRIDTKKNNKLILEYTTIFIKNKNQIYPNFGIDFYNTHKEIKIYEKNQKLKESIDDKVLDNILNSKFCDQVIKYNESGEIINKKYEFYISDFNKNEIKNIKKYNLYDENCKMFSIYINNKEISKNVIYYND
jgi:hypothetical protein